MRLVIAEKPSVARDLARVLGATRKGEGCLEGDGVVVSWCVGHLVELEEPAHYDPKWKRWSFDTLPMVPQAFELRARKEGRDQLAVLSRLMRSRAVDEVVGVTETEIVAAMHLLMTRCKLWVEASGAATTAALLAAWPT